MKLPIPCSECSSGKTESEYQIMKVEVRDDGRYEVECPNGHKNLTLFQQQKFEILFEIGAYAITDGYYREAVSSFSSSLEKFYEFVIKSILFEKGISSEEINKAWKKVSSQSERQLGAFIFLHTYELGESPKYLSNSKVSFRNKVIHKGKIPSREEALKYGQSVLDIINPTLLNVKKNFSDGIDKVKSNHLDTMKKDGDKDYSVQWIRTIVNLLKSGKRNREMTLDRYVKILETKKTA